MQFFKKYFGNKNVAFYVALGVAISSVIIAIAYGATWIKGSESVGTLVLLIIGALAFIGVSYISPTLGATAMTACNVVALALFINASYSAIFNKAISGLNLADPEVVKVIVFAVFMLVLCAAANVFVWVRMKKNTAEREAELYMRRAQSYEQRIEKIMAKAARLREAAEQARAKAEQVAAQNNKEVQNENK